jgi:hypothetical protein
MREMALVFALVVGCAAPAFAQKAEIEAANATWIELFLPPLQSCAAETRSAPCGKAWRRRSATPRPCGRARDRHV